MEGLLLGGMVGDEIRIGNFLIKQRKQQNGELSKTTTTPLIVFEEDFGGTHFSTHNSHTVNYKLQTYTRNFERKWCSYT